MPQTAMIVMAASQVVGGIQQYQAGRAQAKEAERQGEAERAAALAEEQQARTAADYARGSDNARRGASGLTDAGTPLQVMAARAREAEKEALNIRFGGESLRRAYQSKANIARKEATSALFSSLGRAAQTAASGGSFGGGGTTNFLERNPWTPPDGEAIYRRGSR